MIEFTKGNIWETKADAIVIPVNCMGVAGAGLAKQAKEKHLDWFRHYRFNCQVDNYHAGEFMLSYNKKYDNKFLISGFTKDHWAANSGYSNVATLIWKLAKDKDSQINKDKIQSIAVPALGCGYGNLKWEVVKNFMVEQFTDSPIKFIVYEPTD